MAIIQIKYSTTTGHTPTGLTSGQLAINIADGTLFWVNNNNVLQSFSFGSPLVATMGGTDSSTHAASTAFVQGLIAALVNGAPLPLNTLGELAAAINNDPNFAQTINNILVNMLRFDTVQTLNGAQIKQVWANLALGADGTIDGGSF